MSLKNDLLKIQIEDVNHDLLQKKAYVAIRWARVEFAEKPEQIVAKAVARLQGQYPKTESHTIEEAIYAMNFNIGA